MKVAFITTSFPRFEGDYAGIFVYDLARAIVRQGISVHVIAPHDGNAPRREVMDGVQVTRFPYFSPPKWQRVAYGAGIPTNLRNSWLTRIQLSPFILCLFAALRHAVPSSDLIHAHWTVSALLSAPWARLLNRPLVLSVHRYNAQGLFGKAIYRKAITGTAHVVFNSTYTRDHCQQIVRADSSSVIPPGVDVSRFSSKWHTPAKVSSSNGEQHIVFALGSLVPVKGFINLIDGLPLVLQRQTCHIRLGGEGPERERLTARVYELGLEEHVTFLGRVPTSAVPELMRDASIFVLPSIPHSSGDNESLGMVLVEALASGTPCIASHTGGIGDVVDDNVNGFLVTPGKPAELASRIITLLEDWELRKNMGCAGRGKVESQFALDVVARRTIDVYEEVLSRNANS